MICSWKPLEALCVRILSPASELLCCIAIWCPFREVAIIPERGGLVDDCVGSDFQLENLWMCLYVYSFLPPFPRCSIAFCCPFCKVIILPKGGKLIPGGFVAVNSCMMELFAAGNCWKPFACVFTLPHPCCCIALCCPFRKVIILPGRGKLVPGILFCSCS